MTGQLRLEWPLSPDFTADSFVDSAATDEARRMLADRREWPSGAFALVGPEGSGKSHLAAIWRREAAEEAGKGAPAPSLVEDVDRTDCDDRALFALLERAARGESGPVLMTARARPVIWPARLPDLVSRLRALSFAEIETPDDAALSQILRKLLRDRHLRVNDRVIDYVVKRIERSVAGARRAADLLDRLSLETGANVTVPLAARALADEDEEMSA